MAETTDELKTSFKQKLTSIYGIIVLFIMVIGYGIGATIFFYNTFPTINHITGRFVQKIELDQVKSQLDDRLDKYEAKVVEDLKGFKRKYRKEKIVSLYYQLDLVKEELAKEPDNKNNLKFKTQLETQMFDLLEKMDKED
jgi:hypothetical protein